MSINYPSLATWIVQVGLIALLIATLIYARRLDFLLRQVRRDQDSLQSILPEIDNLVSATTKASDRLVQDAKQADLALKDACAAAETMIDKLDDLIGQATRITHARALESTLPDRAAFGTPPKSHRRPVKPTSRVERDLARMLLDAN